MKKIAVMILLSFLAAGCVPVREYTRDEQKELTQRVVEKPYSQVYAAALEVLENDGWNILRDNKETGYIRAQYVEGMKWATTLVKVKRVSETRTAIYCQRSIEFKNGMASIEMELNDSTEERHFHYGKFWDDFDAVLDGSEW